MAGLGIGLAVGLGPPVLAAGGGGGANPNLLLWSEDFTQASAWALVDGDIIATDQDGTADEFASNLLNAAIRQTTTTVATTGGAATASASMTGLLVRYSVTGTFDGLPYTFSIQLKDTGLAAVPTVTLRIDRSGGFLRCSVEDAAGDGDFIVGYAQLEQAAAFTSYHFRGGS